MALQLSSQRPRRNSFLAGTFFAIFALLVQPLVALNVPAAFAAAQTINVTVYPKNSPKGAEESVTFTNTGDQEVNLGGMYVTEQTSSGVDKAFFTVPSDKKLARGAEYTHTSSGKINNDGDTLKLYSDSSQSTLLTTITTNAQGDMATGSFTLDGIEPTPVDTTGPSVSAVQPAAGAVLRGVVPARTLMATISDDLSGVEGTPYANIIVESTGQQATDTGNIPLYHQSGTTYAYTRALDTTKLADGRYQLIVSATDVAGNSTVYNQNKNDHLFTINNVPDVVPKITQNDPVLWDGNNYKGINIDSSYENISNLTGMSVSVLRADSSTVTKTAKEAAIDYLNSRDGKSTPLTVSFVIRAIDYDESTSRAWSLPSETQWTIDTAPESVTITLEFSDRDDVVRNAAVDANGIAYESLIPADTSKPVVELTEPKDGSFNPTQYKIKATMIVA